MKKLMCIPVLVLSVVVMLTVVSCSKKEQQPVSVYYTQNLWAKWSEDIQPTLTRHGVKAISVNDSTNAEFVLLNWVRESHDCDSVSIGFANLGGYNSTIKLGEKKTAEFLQDMSMVIRNYRLLYPE